MLKSLSLISVSAITLLATTQAYSHVLCAPNNPQVNIGHQHNQAYTVPRIQPVVQHIVARPVQQNHNQQKHLQAQRARQQKALANQRRINQQRRQQAQRAQQQATARNAQLIKQQQVAAQQARVLRQQAAQQAARYRAPAPRVVYQQPVQKVVYRQAVQQPVTHYHAPQPVYRAPIVLYFPQQPRRVVHKRTHQKHYNVQHNAHGNYQWVNKKH